MATCPNCRFAGANVLFDGQLKCAGCGTIYRQRLDYPSVPQGKRVAASTGSGRKFAPLIVIAAIVVIMFGGFFVALIDSEEPEPFREQPYPSRSSTHAEPEVEILEVEVAESVIDGSGHSFPWWAVSYRNTGNVPVRTPNVIATFLDKYGNRIQDQTCWSFTLLLPPGDQIWIFVTPSNAERVTDATFVAGELRKAPNYSRDHKRLQVRGIAVEPNESPSRATYPYVTGTVYNPHDVSMRVNMLMAIGYDENDKPCAYASGKTVDRYLGAEGTTTFKINSGIYQVYPPVRWVIDAWGTER